MISSLFYGFLNLLFIYIIICFIYLSRLQQGMKRVPFLKKISRPIFRKPYCHMLRPIAVLSTMSAVMHTINRGFRKQHKKLMI